ncbi:MAG: response regulator transcription factor [Akkermansiaceae bacterium]|nr:response regulator transcription factor [Akkermansiaceae bacterium]NNM27969.1 response regulator transcription factor [Akkermansiaceae bacterium]
MSRPAAVSTAKKGIFLVDDHPIFRRGVAVLVEMEPDLAVCGEASTCHEALDAIPGCHPAIVIADISLENGSDGLGLIKDLKQRDPELLVLVVSMHDEGLYAERAIRAGARGYVHKHEMEQAIVAAIRCILAGDVWMSPSLTKSLARKFLGDQSVESTSPLGTLSDRELEVFRFIGRGRSTREVAEELHLSTKTIDTHRERIKRKLNLPTAQALVHRATLWVESGDTE